MDYTTRRLEKGRESCITQLQRAQLTDHSVPAKDRLCNTVALYLGGVRLASFKHHFTEPTGLMDLMGLNSCKLWNKRKLTLIEASDCSFSASQSYRPKEDRGFLATPSSQALGSHSQTQLQLQNQTITAASKSNYLLSFFCIGSLLVVLLNITVAAISIWGQFFF